MHTSNFTPAKVVHQPIRPCREDTAGEGIYLMLWKEFACNRPMDWHAIFRTAGPVRQRAASVAASYMTFMGTSGGRAFTLMAESLWSSGAFASKELAYRAQWAITNARHSGINSGLRAIEFVLASSNPTETGRVNWTAVGNITMDDIDVIESMVVWWSSDTAQLMRSIAEPMRNSRESQAWKQIFSGEGACA